MITVLAYDLQLPQSLSLSLIWHQEASLCYGVPWQGTDKDLEDSEPYSVKQLLGTWKWHNFYSFYIDYPSSSVEEMQGYWINWQ